MALGIGANAAIFSVVEEARLRPLPFDDASSLMEVWLQAVDPAVQEHAGLTGADLRDLRAEPGLFAALAGWRATSASYVGLSTQETLRAAEVTVGMFSSVLRVQPFLGRTFLPEEDRPGASPAALLSHAFWSRGFGGDPGVIGRSMVLDGTPHVIVGVMPPALAPPFVPEAEVWMPARLATERCRGGCATVAAVGRLAPGTRLEVARDRATAVGRRLAESYPETNRGVTPALTPLRDPRVRMSPRTTRLLLSAGALVLLLACSNVALLLLARGVDRVREIRVRRSVGASRRSVVAQLLAESVGLATAGALLGVGVAVWVLEAIERSAPSELVEGMSFGLDALVLSGVAVLTLGSGLLFGVGPAVAGARAEAPFGRPGSPGSLSALRATRFVRGTLGAFQIGLATVLLLGAAGLLQSLEEATGDGLGFNPVDVLVVPVELTSSPFSTAAERAERLALVTERVESVAGVFSLGAAASLPFGESPVVSELHLRDEEERRTLSETVVVRFVSPAYFYAMEQRLSEGRWFRLADVEDATPVAMVSTTAARRLASDIHRSAVGAEIAVDVGMPEGSIPWRTVVGVVHDEWSGSDIRPSEAVVYVPLSQALFDRVRLVVRVDGDPAVVAAGILDVLGDIDPAWRSAEVGLFGDRVRRAHAGERFGVLLAGAFAALALGISLVGLFGVLAHTVATRVGEWGLRRAIGATDQEIRGSILARGATLAFIGVALGAAGARFVAGGFEAAFSGVAVRTPLVYAGSVTILAIAVLVASAWPAKQSVTTDVVSALRME